MAEDLNYGYLLGQLTALVEMALPEIEGGELIQKKLAYLVAENESKLDPWLNEVLKMELEGLPEDTKSEFTEAVARLYEMRAKNPGYSPLDDSGRYFIGYYHQKARNSIQLTRQKLGKRIKEIREAKGLSQRELGSMCDIAYNHISRIEAGKYNVSIDTLAKISAALDAEITIG